MAKATKWIPTPSAQSHSMLFIVIAGMCVVVGKIKWNDKNINNSGNDDEMILLILKLNIQSAYPTHTHIEGWK